MQGIKETKSGSTPPSSRIASRAIDRLANMDRAEELCLLTAAFCAFGSAVAAQKRNA